MRTVAFLALSLGLVEFGTPAGRAQDLETTLEHYSTLNDQKAFAVAVDDGGTAVWGYSSDHTSIGEAAAAALDECEERRVEFGLAAECRLRALGNDSLLGLPEPEVQDASAGSGGSMASSSDTEDIQYETQWIEGNRFLVARARDAHVWIAFSTEGGPHALVFVANAGEDMVTFRPTEITATGIRRGNRDAAKPMVTLSADEYERKVRRRHAIVAGLAGASAALANQPQPQVATVQGSSHGQARVSGPYGSATATTTGSYYGTITTWPTGHDYAEANARTMAQTRALASQLRSSFEAMAATLARNHSMPPGSFYGGVVWFKKHRADAYRVEVPFAGREFSFEFSRGER